jgi:hypothetical protein
MVLGSAIFAGASEGGTLAAVSTANVPATGAAVSNDSLTRTDRVQAGFLADFFVTRLPVVATGFSVASAGEATEAEGTGSPVGAVWPAASAGSTADVWGFAKGIGGSSATGFTTGGAGGGGAALASCPRATPAAVVRRIAAINARHVNRMTSAGADRSGTKTPRRGASYSRHFFGRDENLAKAILQPLNLHFALDGVLDRLLATALHLDDIPPLIVIDEGRRRFARRFR